MLLLINSFIKEKEKQKEIDKEKEIKIEEKVKKYLFKQLKNYYTNI